MFNKMIRYTCPKCGAIGAHYIDMKCPLCHKCDYKVEMKPSRNGKIIVKEK